MKHLKRFNENKKSDFILKARKVIKDNFHDSPSIGQRARLNNYSDDDLIIGDECALDTMDFINLLEMDLGMVLPKHIDDTIDFSPMSLNDFYEKIKEIL